MKTFIPLILNRYCSIMSGPFIFFLTPIRILFMQLFRLIMLTFKTILATCFISWIKLSFHIQLTCLDAFYSKVTLTYFPIFRILYRSLKYWFNLLHDLFNDHFTLLLINSHNLELSFNGTVFFSLQIHYPHSFKSKGKS